MVTDSKHQNHCFNFYHVVLTDHILTFYRKTLKQILGLKPVSIVHPTYMTELGYAELFEFRKFDMVYSDSHICFKTR